MVISHKLITNDYNSYLKDYNKILLIIINLHLEGKISDERLKALFKNYRNKTLHRYVNNYHCKINNKWYNNDYMLNIYLDIYSSIPKKDLTLEQVLPYINWLLNKNKNYCIDFIYKQYVEPIINSIDIFDSNSIDIFNSFKIKNEVEITPYHKATGLGDGYCCEDHDGDLEQYKMMNYRSQIGYDFKKKLFNLFKSFLQSKKTLSSYKNPNNIFAF